jgi:L-cysteine desulfidase
MNYLVGSIDKDRIINYGKLGNSGMRQTEYMILNIMPGKAVSN